MDANESAKAQYETAKKLAECQLKGLKVIKESMQEAFPGVEDGTEPNAGVNAAYDAVLMATEDMEDALRTAERMLARRSRA